MMEALNASETSILTRATWHNIPEDAILHLVCGQELNPGITEYDAGWLTMVVMLQ
jgi:hypothetical protein